MLAGSALLLAAPSGAVAGGTLTGKLSHSPGSVAGDLDVELQHTYDQPIEFLNLELKQSGFELAGSLFVVPSRVPAQCALGQIGFQGTRAIACTFGAPRLLAAEHPDHAARREHHPGLPGRRRRTVNACLQPCTGPPSAVGPFDIRGAA